ncbi:TPA: hypothetical protein RG395_002935 [Legionella pneumophila]|nr:hypothetical protein [Legionella pneumophila]HAT1847350.1 hypothetical protein [Legionella pneumophila]HAT1862425.1 hypothetical protein [Legionella pneumophila]HAT3977414.1 hypothetical protein [Legionella pneumophila]HAT8357827.1 hypothetical protein [Legionella pneumophila]HAU1208393.1 hypothetical protein [Legionella pneumophila]
MTRTQAHLPYQTTVFSSLKIIPLVLNWLLKFALLIIIIAVFIPLSPKMPAPGLDASWAVGLNQAIAQGLAFGKDIFFTLGPYSSIYTKFYHPATDFMMVGGSLYLALCYWIAIIFLMQGIKWRWSIAFAILLFSMIYARDSLFFSYSLIIGLLIHKEIHGKESFLKSNFFILFALLFTPFGLFPLIKGSLLILSIITMLLCSFFLSLYKQRTLALLVLASPLVSMLFFWIASGQSIFHLPSYISNTILLASGFTEAMATEGDNKELVVFGITSFCILLSILLQKKLSPLSKAFLFCTYFVFLFLSYKTGFTRHFGHAFIAGTSVLLASFLLPYLNSNNKVIIPVLALSLYTASYINGHYTKISVHDNFISTYTTAYYGLKNRIQNKNWLKENFSLTMNYLKTQDNFPILPGTTDIYSYNQTSLIASGMQWSPRPIFQSYSAFTANMAEINKNYLLSENKPDNIIFKVEPIDNRIPSMEDGMSWPTLINHYQPVRFENDFLFLRKKLVNKPVTPLVPLKTEIHTFGEQVKIPDTDIPLFVEIDIEPTFWGMLATTFFKPHQLEANLELKNGTLRQYRLIANMAKSGFLLSPFIENSAEFGLLFSQNNYLAGKKVISFSINSKQVPSSHWQTKYTIHYKILSSNN